MKIKTKRRIVFTISVIIAFIIMITIRRYSSMTGSESSTISKRLSEWLFMLLEKQGNNLYSVKGIEGYIRKFAHILEYFILASAFYTIIYIKNRRIILSFIVSLLLSGSFAVFDEIFQTSIPGRTGQLFDVFVDIFGILLSLVLCAAISLVHRFTEK
jgi:VanZ family protein